MAGLAQPQDLVLGGLLGGGDARAGPAVDEEAAVAGAEVTHHRLHAGLGVAEPGAGLGRGQAVEEVRP
jgi:hypothetical protein